MKVVLVLDLVWETLESWMEIFGRKLFHISPFEIQVLFDKRGGCLSTLLISCRQGRSLCQQPWTMVLWWGGVVEWISTKKPIFCRALFEKIDFEAFLYMHITTKMTTLQFFAYISQTVSRRKLGIVPFNSKFNFTSF